MKKDRQPPPEAMSSDELAAEAAVDLPEREAMSTFGHHFGHPVDTDFGNFAMPINTSEAANVNTTDSVAAADADQTVIIYQSSDK
jgi:hypothetical protein